MITMRILMVTTVLFSLNGFSSAGDDNMKNDEKSSTSEWPWLKYGIAPTTNPACVPTQRTDWAMNYHKGMLGLENKAQVKVLFLGDSIMNDMWRSRSLVYAERVKEGGNQVWQKYYAPLNAANFGISADETGNLLWRIAEGGCLEGLHPEVAVLLIGINNLIRGQTPEQTAEGITTIVGYLKNKLPDTKILLLGIFPCWQPATNPIRAKVKQTNLLISKLHDGQRIFYLDIGHVLVEPDGNILKDKLQDTLHPSEKGYELWAEAMQPYLFDLLNNGKMAINNSK